VSDGDRTAIFDVIEADLSGVELALARLGTGTYFTCESCGAPLSDDVLAASPITRRCGNC
jgi:RNA polymerase-binding transcription factor DksA